MLYNMNGKIALLDIWKIRYPDADALHDWYARAVEMNRTLGTRLYIPTWYYNLMDHPEAIARRLDLADLLVAGRIVNSEL